MTAIKITFLGTGTSQGVPLIACQCNVCKSDDPRDKRLRSSVLIQVKDKNFVIDTGPDFRQQMLRENVRHLNAVIFTHEHKDHIAGMDDIRAFNFIQKKKMDIYATDRVQEAIKREFHYIFANKTYPGIPQVELHEIKNEPFTIEGVEFIPIEVMHMHMPVLGFRIGDFTYITDANFIAETEKEKIKGSKVVVLNALRRETHPSHFTLQQATELMQELNPETGYFTHISHQLGKHADVENELPENIRIATDGLSFEV